MRRFVLAIALLAGLAAPARADRRAVVAILPFTTADDTLSIYSKAAATALTRELRGLEGVDVQTVSLSDSPPSGVALVIDGRIVPGKKSETVSLELTVRDPELGAAGVTVSTRAAPLSEIDSLVSDAGQRLRGVLARALRDKRARLAERDAPIRLHPTVVEGDDGRPRTAPRAAAARIVVLDATGEVAGGSVAVGPIATRAARDLVGWLGYRPASGGTGAVSSHADAAAAAERSGAAAALRVHVESVEFDWVGVLTARGRVRVVLTGADGNAVFDRTVRTDTIVGSRGDRHAAVVGMVCDQAMDIAGPPIRRALRGQ